MYSVLLRLNARATRATNSDQNSFVCQLLTHWLSKNCQPKCPYRWLNTWKSCPYSCHSWNYFWSPTRWFSSSSSYRGKWVINSHLINIKWPSLYREIAIKVIGDLRAVFQRTSSQEDGIYICQFCGGFSWHFHIAEGSSLKVFNSDERCPICFENIHLPVTTSCGHLFCGNTIVYWIPFFWLCLHLPIGQCILILFEHSYHGFKCPYCREMVSHFRIISREPFDQPLSFNFNRLSSYILALTNSESILP